jgi:DNA-binding transcriptional LysR family regulator
MWEAVELREIRVFLTLADELHFGRSAERLGLTTSRVSQSLRALERKLGGPLMHRTSRRVALTPSGSATAANWRRRTESWHGSWRASTPPTRPWTGWCGSVCSTRPPAGRT